MYDKISRRFVPTAFRKTPHTGKMEMKKKTLIPVFMVVLFLAVAGVARAETLAITLEAGPYEIIQNPDGYQKILMDGYPERSSPGDPMLPVKVFNILLPPDIDWSSLTMRTVLRGRRLLPGRFELRPGAPDESNGGLNVTYDWGNAVNIVDGRNMDVYGANAFFPSPPDRVKLLPCSQLRKWKFTRVAFTPFRYNPVTRKLVVAQKAKIILNFQRTNRISSPSLMADRVMDSLAPKLFTNFESMQGGYVPPKAMDQASAVYDYVIITTNAIVSGSSKLADFISQKQARGHSVLVVTETDFGALTGQAPNNRAEKIRQWLINNYVSYGIEYVLLIGDPTPYENGEGDIPMKMCWPRLGIDDDDEAPTDGFFADLTGNWDLDNDQDYGELLDYLGGGGVDFSMEVWVGRIPVYASNYSTLDAILQKTMDYENERSVSWRKNVLLPMSFSNITYDGAPLAEQMMDDFLTTGGFGSWTQYQQGSNEPCDLNSSYASDEELRGNTVVRDRWAVGGYGVVCWWAHGSVTSASVGCSGCWDGTLFSYTQTSSLNDDLPSFTYQCSCTNGYPENSNNLQYSILKQGGIGTVSATRVSWYNTGVGYGDFDGSSTNSGIAYEYVSRLAQNLPAGRALYEAKLAVVSPILSGTRLMNQYDFNLYGDPSVGLNSSGSTSSLPFMGPLLLDN